ncbi:MAG: DNA-processing protein DprA, partial [Spirochaetales bacterium]|nr:DNA-processing protein DprA [Spirochaetales bacterium]
MNYIDITSDEYPYLLRQIKDPPPKLYFRGNWDPDIFKETLSVVGSRRMTRYGEIITHSLVSAIASKEITIVSGFMYGIDAQAHNAALESGGRTIAVMPCGIEKIHPEYQSDLHERILNNNGLVVSEYTGDAPPALWTYPRRNRIIAGLSPLLLVVEAGIKSGALITAKIAAKYNKKIFAVPGP